MATRRAQVAKFGELRNTYVVKNTGKLVGSVMEPDRTRDQLARRILEAGPATAVELADFLAITPAGIRRHLDALVAEGVLTAREPHQTSSNLRGRGRPAKVFVMTDLGRETFEHSYDDLAVSALKFMASAGGATLVTEFAQSRAVDIERRASAATAASKSATNRVQALAAFLTEEGFAATARSRGNGEEICQNHCPIAHVAAEFPALCDAETEALSRVLGTHVQRLATIAHGDGVCTTFIPQSASTRETLSAQNLTPAGKRAN
ncbi:MAG: transcriptional regulator [Actinomycetes bacterium]|jgi:predicted ArsR family transcriptional regulator